MKTAVAADSPEVDKNISRHGARAAFYLIFGDDGSLQEQLENPFVSIDRGAGPGAANFLADQGVETVVVGECGQRFATELESRGVRIIHRDGLIADVVRDLSR